MKPYAILRTLFLHALITPVPGASSAIQALYLFKDVFQSNTTALTTSGFNTLIIFGVGILSNSDIMYYSNTPGPGPTTPLYRNLAALDAVNQDDESIYHADSTVAFGRMLGAVALRYSIAPYDGRVVSFWAAVRSRVGWGAMLDRVYLQCYDGGAGNEPAAWQSQLGTKVVPLLWVVNDSKPGYGVSAAQARDRFAAWSKQAAVAGGGYWTDFDVETMGLSYQDYGGVLTGVFP